MGVVLGVAVQVGAQAPAGYVAAELEAVIPQVEAVAALAATPAAAESFRLTYTFTFGGLLEADITGLKVDAIANAANTELLHAGGVAAAISRAGGANLERESRERAPIGLGEAVETTAGEMPARWVIHAATMKLGGPTSAEVIGRATSATLQRADELEARSLALVAFGTGVGGFPLEDAARIEVEAVDRHLAAGSSLERIVFAVRGGEAREAFEAAVTLAGL